MAEEFDTIEPITDSSVSIKNNGALPMNKNTRLGIIALALAGLAGLGYYAYTANRAPASGPGAPAGGAAAKPGGGAPGGFAIAVEVAKIAAADFSDEASAVGNLKSNESVVMRPETAGRIAAVNFKDGAIVAKGAVLVTLDAAVQEAELQQARANLALARSNHKRNQELLEKKFVTAQALDNSAATLKVQEAAVQLAEAKVGRMRIKAPFNGMVGLRNVSVGDYVKEGQDLINIEDIGTLRVDFRLPETYLGRDHQGTDSSRSAPTHCRASNSRRCSMPLTPWSTRTGGPFPAAPASTTRPASCGRACSSVSACSSANARTC